MKRNCEIEKRYEQSSSNRKINSKHFDLANHSTFRWKFQICTYIWWGQLFLDLDCSHRFSEAMRFCAHKCFVRWSLSCESTEKVFPCFSNRITFVSIQKLNRSITTRVERVATTAQWREKLFLLSTVQSTIFPHFMLKTKVFHFSFSRRLHVLLNVPFSNERPDIFFHFPLCARH